MRSSENNFNQQIRNSEQSLELNTKSKYVETLKAYRIEFDRIETEIIKAKSNLNSSRSKQSEDQYQLLVFQLFILTRLLFSLLNLIYLEKFRNILILVSKLQGKNTTTN